MSPIAQFVIILSCRKTDKQIVSNPNNKRMIDYSTSMTNSFNTYFFIYNINFEFQLDLVNQLFVREQNIFLVFKYYSNRRSVYVIVMLVNLVKSSAGTSVVSINYKLKHVYVPI